MTVTAPSANSNNLLRSVIFAVDPTVTAVKEIGALALCARAVVKFVVAEAAPAVIKVVKAPVKLALLVEKSIR